MSAQGQNSGQDWARRFHLPHTHLESVFGGDWFALKAEAFARFFGTPTFLVGQTIIVGVWMLQPGEDLVVARRLREVLREAARA